MNRVKILNYLGLARRANKVVAGSDMVLRMIKQRKAKIVFVANDAAANTIKTFEKKCYYYKILFVNEYTSDELSRAIGKPICMVLAITDQGFFDAINGQSNGGIK
ncbi:MAG: ribosomal L7Ae/L30e/S12e/Gadd45 family protein [Bacilli bacterium]|nr:ribosomal L7Ae/L30e/S12e/Gadd45 family protein [Bacilli bacterium]MDD4076552.1 ribosomal L7Ae/L30e/S12e/Gadd45 family protein [Bacilli bacterium]MDD4387740.1 ribosomal L7Ae/L30e/S12e/Gadd45 family protein [Bacilli bacterium]